MTDEVERIGRSNRLVEGRTEALAAALATLSVLRVNRSASGALPLSLGDPAACRVWHPSSPVSLPLLGALAF